MREREIRHEGHAGPHVAREFPKGWKPCEGGTCNNPVANEKDANMIQCKQTDLCKHKNCECHLFSFDPSKPKDPYRHEAASGTEVKKEHGRTYECKCVTAG